MVRSATMISSRALRTAIQALASATALSAATLAAAQVPYFYGAKVPQSGARQGDVGCSGLEGQVLYACINRLGQQHIAEEEEEMRAMDEREKAARDDKAKKAADELTKRRQWEAETAAAQAVEERKPETHATRIRGLRTRIAQLQSVIARERRIGATSGFVNRNTLYRAGQEIEFHREKIQQEYRAYLKTGGRRSLSQI